MTRTHAHTHTHTFTSMVVMETAWRSHGSMAQMYDGVEKGLFKLEKGFWGYHTSIYEMGFWGHEG